MDSKNLKKIIEKIKYLSFLSMGRTSPNPPVGAVISDPKGDILATGNTQAHGLDHAERDAYHHFESTIPMEHQLYVSLEPCTHFGKTPPCRDLVIEKKPSNVFIGWKDPNPLVKSGDWKLYESSQIEVKLHPLLAQASLPFLHGFFQRIKKNRPWVWVKSAITSDGFYASSDERQIQISSKESNYYLQILRAKFDAIVVGPKTIQVDMPGLDFRLEEKHFEERGEVSKVDFGQISDFFSPGEHLLDSLLSANEEIFQAHDANQLSYQPLRVFVLKDGMELPSDFLLKQSELNRKYNKKLCLFYILNSKGNVSHYKQSDLEELTSLSIFPCKRISEMDSHIFLHDLANLGINTVLLEAGSFLWNFIKDNLDAEDCILTIQSAHEMKNGKEFLGLNQFEKQSHYQVGTDIWQIERKS